MAAKDRIAGEPFTCCNRRFQTDVNKGKPHGPGNARGSVFDEPLVPGAYSLWLEHAVNKENDSSTFWLMWYDAEGSPTIPMSGIISEEQIEEMARRLRILTP